VELTGSACVWAIVPPGEALMVERPNELEFLAEVLGQVENLPEGFAERLAKLVAEKPADRAEAIRRLIEELAGA
jgi:hypothetical protein